MAFSSIARSNFSHRPPTVPNDSQMTRRKAKIALLVIWHSSIGPSVLLASCCVKIPQLMKFPPSTTRKWATNWRKCRKILKVIVMALTTLSFFWGRFVLCPRQWRLCVGPLQLCSTAVEGSDELRGFVSQRPSCGHYWHTGSHTHTPLPSF